MLATSMNCVDHAKNARSKKPIAHSAIVGVSNLYRSALQTIRLNKMDWNLAVRNRRQPITCPIFQTAAKKKGLSVPPKATNNGVDE